MKKSLTITIVTLVLSIALTGCGIGGGGGGGSEDSSPAQGIVRSTPANIDSGDITSVSVEIREVTRNVLLKVRYPSALSFVQNTALMFVPDANASFDHFPSEARADESTYLVFFLKPGQFSSDGRGTLSFDLLGDFTTKGEIEIDIDIENEDVDNSFEFSVANPNFTTISDTRIEVRDS